MLLKYAKAFKYKGNIFLKILIYKGLKNVKNNMV